MNDADESTGSEWSSSQEGDDDGEDVQEVFAMQDHDEDEDEDGEEEEDVVMTSKGKKKTETKGDRRHIFCPITFHHLIKSACVRVCERQWVQRKAGGNNVKVSTL